MRVIVAEDEVAEIAVVGDEDTSLSAGNGEHFLVAERARVVVGDCGNIVAQTGKEGGKAKLRARIEEKLHKG